MASNESSHSYNKLCW